jgi:hypothetical protein
MHEIQRRSYYQHHLNSAHPLGAKLGFFWLKQIIGITGLGKMYLSTSILLMEDLYNN